MPLSWPPTLPLPTVEGYGIRPERAHPLPRHPRDPLRRRQPHSLTMPDPALSEAIREAYASAPADVVVLHTLEIWHPSFTEDGVAKPIRVVRNYEDTATWLGLGGVEVQAVLDGLDAEARRKIGLVARIEAGVANRRYDRRR